MRYKKEYSKLIVALLVGVIVGYSFAFISAYHSAATFCADIANKFVERMELNVTIDGDLISRYIAKAGGVTS